LGTNQFDLYTTALGHIGDALAGLRGFSGGNLTFSNGSFQSQWAGLTLDSRINNASDINGTHLRALSRGFFR
jgi:hypothetical protein